MDRSTPPTRRTLCASLAAAACAAAVPMVARAQSGKKPYTLVVPYPPGGSTDLLGRLFADALGAQLGEKVVVENRAGANGTMGSAQVSAAEGDGRTLLYAFGNLLLNQQYMMKEGRLTVLQDLVPVIRTCMIQAVIVAHIDAQAKDLAEFIALARKSPGKYSYAYYGDLTSAAIAAEAGLELIRVPYKGGMPGMLDVVGGRVDIMSNSLAQALPMLRAGKLKALAITGDQRLGEFPNTPTLKEVLPGFRSLDYQVVLAPKATSKAVTEELYRKSLAALSAPDMSKQFRDRGAIISPMRPDELRAFMETDQAGIAAVVKAAGIQPE